MKELLKVGEYSALESFVRNIAFMLMIVCVINMVGEQGHFGWQMALFKLAFVACITAWLSYKKGLWRAWL